jgi:hypothetical protein
LNRADITARLEAAREEYAAARSAAEADPTAENLQAVTALALEINGLNTELSALPADEAPVADEAPAVVTASVASEVTETGASRSVVITAGADVYGHATGTELDFSEVAVALNRKATSLPRAAAGGPRFSNQYTIAQIQKPVDPRFVVADDDPSAAISFASAEHNTPKGSLLASGGWCAPSETWYDLLDLSTTSGIISLPEVTANRGGFRLIPGGGAQFQDIYTDTGFCFTEAQDIAGDYGSGGGVQPKPCYSVECPEWTDYRLDVCGICVRAGYLQNRAYPELTADVLRKTLTAHRHRLAANKINQIVTGSTAVAIPTNGTDPGAAAPILNAVELQAIDIRTKYRMDVDATLEGVFPVWAKALFRADLAYRRGKAEIDVTDAEIMAWLRQRGIAAQFVYNWQDLGQVSAATALPTTLAFLIYPAGTWVAAVSDVIDLGVVHDSSLMAFNNYTAAFVEEGYVMLPVGPESRVIELEVCPSGSIGSRSIACTLES